MPSPSAMAVAAHAFGRIPRYHGPMTEKLKRRLTTVLCADVQGYSRLMEADEPGTLATLRRYRTAMAALVERHDGRIVNTWGDAVIAEFSSVVEAVQCAIETQRELSTQDAHLPEEQRMRFRIGINLGDVMVDGSDIYGDGVNIAARLQELAQPGGILISGPVYDQVHNKLTVSFDYLGRKQVRNVASPVTSYRVSLNGSGEEHSMPHEEVGSDPTAGIGNEVAALRPSDDPASRRLMRTALNRFAGLPRPLRGAILISAFLFLINIFSGTHEIWFHWPTAGMLLTAGLWMIFRRSPARERRKRPPAD
jgi:adenylate cyclase